MSCVRIIIPLALDADNLHGGGMIPTEMAGAGRNIGTGRHLVLMLLCKSKREGCGISMYIYREYIIVQLVTQLSHELVQRVHIAHRAGEKHLTAIAAQLEDVVKGPQ